MSIFAENVNECHFRNQEPDEKILQIIRRHWFNILLQYLPVIGFAIVLWLCAAFLPEFIPDLKEPEYSGLFWFFESLMFLILWMMSALIFVDYYLDVWILTDRRVINIEQKSLFRREISELYYQKIQDVSTEVHGLIPTLLNYGDVYIQTAAEQARFLFHNVPNPNGIKASLMDLQKRNKSKDWKDVGDLFQKKMDGEE